MSDDLVAIHGCCSVKLQHICLRNWYHSIRHAPGPLIINEKSYSTDAHPSDIPTHNVKLYQTRLLHCHYNIHVCWSSVTPWRELLYRCSCNIYACWPCVTDTNTAAVQTCLLVECCCKMDAYWTVATQSSCLPILCLSILHACCRCASLSAIPAGMVSHCQSCLLVSCLTIGHAFWCSASL